MSLNEERSRVIENIAAAVAEGDSFRKVELFDPVITEEDIRRVILPFDLQRRKALSRIKSFAARLIAEGFTKQVNANTAIVDLDNALGVEGGAFITSNHYNPTDSTPIRMLAIEAGRRKRLDIVVQQSNVFMTGLFGFLMKNANTLPVSSLPEYTVNRLTPALGELLGKGHFILVYPEQEMWYNYKKPRDLRDGVYHWAAKFGVPIIPTFTEMQTVAGEVGKDGFLPIRHILHVMPPICPDPALSVRENRIAMQRKDAELKRKKYEEVYGIPLDNKFIPERDIAGYPD